VPVLCRTPRNDCLPYDRLTAQREYLKNALRKRVFAPITAISLKKLPGSSGYEVQPTLTRGNAEQTLSLQLPFADPALRLCANRDLTEIATAIMTDLRQLICS
jgi:hypothetical protein